MATYLCKIAEHYIVDKCPKYNHSYTIQYDELLKNKEYNLILEIGVGFPELMKKYTNDKYESGASLKMWRDYFGCNVIGLDIKEFNLNESNIQTIIADQSNPESLENAMKQIFPSLPDLIVDDGSHLIDHQIITFKTLWKYCSDIYIIEDIDRKNMAKIFLLGDLFPNCRVKKAYISDNENQGFIAFEKISILN